MKASAARMSVISPARRLMSPVSARMEAKAMMSAKAVKGATWLASSPPLSAVRRPARAAAASASAGASVKA